MDKDPFKEYLKESEPDKLSKSYAWSTAIGLQDVDRLKPSKYLIDTAIQNIEGNITIKEARNLIESYYEKKMYIRMMIVQKKQIKYLHELQKYCRKHHFHFHQMNISLYTADYFMEYIGMPEK